LEGLRELMRAKGVDLVVLSTTSNMYYLTGFIEEQMERPLLFFVTEESEFFLAPKMYEGMLPSGFEAVYYLDGENPFSKLDLRAKVLAVDDQMWSLHAVPILEKVNPERVVMASSLLGELRAVKDEEEVEAIRKAGEIARRAFESVREKVKEGMSEDEIARIYEEEVRSLGAQIAFETIVGSGPNSALPHHRHSSRKIRRDDVIVLDFGVRLYGYNVDIARPLFVGELERDKLETFEAVLRAQSRAVAEAVEGRTAKELDKVARDELGGLSKFFTHRLGHGIGLDVHELPYISPDSDYKLRKGNVFTLEPGVYFPGKFGIRIEDTFVLKDKLEPLDSVPKSLDYLKV
jgi:Xaa-Pro aminopeptidase